MEAIVIDNGSSQIKAGLSGEDDPRISFPSVVGHARVGEDVYVGDEAFSKRHSCTLKRPIEHGIVTDFDSMELLWRNTFSELREVAEEHPVLLTEVTKNPKANRERTTQIFFETFDAPAFYLQNAQVAALYASGRATGLVLDVGAAQTSAVPVYEGGALVHAAQQTEFAGNGLTDCMLGLLKGKNSGLDEARPAFARDYAREIKENLGFVARDFEGEMRAAAEASEGIEKTYEMPDGSSFSITSERFRCAEALFQPALAESEASSIIDLLREAIRNVDKDVHDDLYKNIVITGGSLAFTGATERILADMSASAPAGQSVNVIKAGADTRSANWQGCSLLAGLSTFNTMWITRAEYDETGPGIVARKCF